MANLKFKEILTSPVKIDLFPIKIYFLWRIIILFFQLFWQSKVFSFDQTSLFQKLYLNWITLWDSGHYLTIALKGYEYPEQAFFPFWPWLLKILALSGISIYKIDFFLSFFLSLSVFVLFYNLAAKLLGQAAAKFSLLFLASFPTSFFLVAGYTESLFLSLTLGSFILLEKGYRLLSSLLAAPTTMTRSIGLGTAFAYLSLKISLPKKVFLFLIALSGLFIFMFYLRFTFNDALLFLNAQKERSARYQTLSWANFPLWPILQYPLKIYPGAQNLAFDFYFLDWAASLLFLFLLGVVYKKLSFNYFIYALFVVLIPLSSGKFESLQRYVLPAFPCFFVFPTIFKSRLFFFIVCLVLFLLQLWLMTRFLNYLWVA